MLNWKPTQWRVLSDDRDGEPPITIDLMTSPFYEGERFAVRRGGACLNVKGKWEYEPLPSSRTDAFYARCRFTARAYAVVAAEEAMKREGASK